MDIYPENGKNEFTSRENKTIEYRAMDLKTVHIWAKFQIILTVWWFLAIFQSQKTENTLARKQLC